MASSTDEMVAGLPASRLLAAKRPGMTLTDAEPNGVDTARLRRGRLARLRAMLRERDYAGVVLFDPNNQRYATGSRNMFGYFLRNSSRYIYVPAEGPVVLFEYPHSAHVSQMLDTIDEARTSKVVWSSVRGQRPRDGRTLRGRDRGPGANPRLGHQDASASTGASITWPSPSKRRGWRSVDCRQDMLHCRRIKTPEEIACLRAEHGEQRGRGRRASRGDPAWRERERALRRRWCGAVIARGGEMVETRLVSSGTRTNPWFNEASGRLVRPGELVAVDTDTIGCFGYYSDFSRTFFCGPGRPSAEQKALYRMAYDQLRHNMSIIAPGMTYREIAERAWKMPERIAARRYTSVMHGCGMHGETPFIPHLLDWGAHGTEGAIEP